MENLPMTPEDKFTLCRVMTTLFVGFLILPYFILARRIHIPFWFSNILLLIMWLLVVAMERLRDKGMGNSPLFEIITIVYASIVMPLFLWTLLAVYINN